MSRRWIVDYKTPTWEHSLIEIHCDDKSEIRKILKKHLGSDNFKINRITERVVNNELQRSE